MKIKFNSLILLLGLIILVISKEPKTKKKKITTEITITTSNDEEESEDRKKSEYEEEENREMDYRKNGTESETESQKAEIQKKEQREKQERERKEREEKERKEREEKERKEREEKERKEREEKERKEKERKEREEKERKEREEKERKEKERKEKERKEREEKERKEREKEEREQREKEQQREKEEKEQREKEEREQRQKEERKNKEKEEKDLIEEEEEKKETEESEIEREKAIRRSKKNSAPISPNKILVITAPYQDNEDYMVTSFGLGTPVNFVPLQIDTTSYKSWVASSSNEDSSSAFSYDKTDSKTSEEPGEWDTVVDEEGTISGNVIYDKAHLGKFELNHFKFIEAIEYEDEFRDYKFGKMGLGNCQYADENNLEYCLLQRLKDNGSIERRIFSLREYSDTHGEIVIGDVTSFSKENDYPLLSVVDQDVYDDIEDDEFKMGWLTKVSHIVFKNSPKNEVKNVFKNNIHIEDGLASFDSSCHYIEAPYSYINEFQDQLFNQYYPNACRRVNNDGTYMFFCDIERFDKIKDNNKDLSFIIVIDGYGFSIPMEFLFEQTSKNDYEFFVHFKDFEQNIWNLGHPFFHHYTIIFDQDNQEIGIDGENIYDLRDETESALKNLGGFRWFKIILMVLVLLIILVAICWLLRRYGIGVKLDNGVSPSLVDNESVDDLSFAPGQNIQ